MKAIFALARKLLPEPPGDVQPRLLVFQGEPAGPVDDPWLKRIITLADGRAAGDIAQTLYLEELRAGADMADIGLWRDLFHDEVIKTLHQMSARGYVRLISQDSPDFGNTPTGC